MMLTRFLLLLPGMGAVISLAFALSIDDSTNRSDNTTVQSSTSSSLPLLLSFDRNNLVNTTTVSNIQISSRIQASSDEIKPSFSPITTEATVTTTVKDDLLDQTSANDADTVLIVTDRDKGDELSEQNRPEATTILPRTDDAQTTTTATLLNLITSSSLSANETDIATDEVSSESSPPTTTTASNEDDDEDDEETTKSVTEHSETQSKSSDNQSSTVKRKINSVKDDNNEAADIHANHKKDEHEDDTDDDKIGKKSDPNFGQKQSDHTKDDRKSFENDDKSNKNNKSDDKSKKDSDDEDDNDDDEEEDENEIAENICTAEYFIDRIVPEDYPQPVEKSVKHINETIERINRLYKFSGKILQNFNPLIREMGSRIMDFFYEAQIEPQCLGSFVRIIRGVQQRRPWAVSFIDATGSVITGGFQEGRFVSFGEFEQCIAIQSKSDDEMIAGQPIRGQYCMVKPVIPLPDSIVRGESIVKPEVEIMNRVLSDQYIETYLGLFRYMKNTILKLGLCLPSNCKPQEIENALNKFFIRKSGLSIQIGPRCVTANDSIEIDSYQAISIFIFAFLALLIVASTIYELLHRLMNHVEQEGACMQLPLTQCVSKRICTPTSFSEPKLIFSTVRFQRQASTMSSPYNEKPIKLQILTLFSLIRNTRVLFDTPPTTRKTTLDTIRLLLILFFFVSNAYIYTIIFAPMLLKRFYVIGPLQLLNDKKYFFIRMYYMINGFVVLSGISMVLSYRPKRFQYFQFISITYLRYAVPILFTIGAIYVIPLLNSGPMWSQFNDTITESCRYRFWPTVLFYNNFNYNVETVCNFPTVFVSLIFQLKLIAPFIVAYLTNFPTKKIFFIISFLLGASMALNLGLRFYFGIRIPHEYSQMQSFSEIKHSVMFFNFNPLTYLSTLIFGIGVGFLIKHRIQFRHLHVLLFGLVSFVFFIFGIIYMESMELRQKKIGLLPLITIISWGRIPMLSFISWLVYASEERHIVMAKRFLSSVVWYPLCQLSYGFYISSLIVNGYRLFSIHENITLAPQVMFRAIVSDAVITFLFSYLIHVFIIQPMKNFHYILTRYPLSIFCFKIGTSSYECSSNATTIKRPTELKFAPPETHSTCSSPSDCDLQNNNNNNNNDMIIKQNKNKEFHLEDCQL